MIVARSQMVTTDIICCDVSGDVDVNHSKPVLDGPVDVCLRNISLSRVSYTTEIATIHTYEPCVMKF